MRIQFLLASSLFAAACSGSGGQTVTGVRSDGLTVSCEEQFDYVSTCTPEDGDNDCETWEDGGAATVLWPPNHKLVQFTLEDCAGVVVGCEPPPEEPPPGEGPIITLTSGPASVAAPVAITKITSDEDVDVGAGGDGHTTNYDVAIIDDTTFALRAERKGGGDGRVYRVHFVDENGDAGACEFLVPHDRGPTGGAVDSGTAVTVTP